MICFVSCYRSYPGRCRLARRAGSPLMPPLCARRRSAPDWPFMSDAKEFKSLFKNKISRWETGYKQTPQIKPQGLARPPRRRPSPHLEPHLGTRPRPRRGPQARRRPARGLHGTPRPRRRRPGHALERLLGDPGRRRRQLREIQSKLPGQIAREVGAARRRRALARGRLLAELLGPALVEPRDGGRGLARLAEGALLPGLGRGVRNDGRQRRPALGLSRRWRQHGRNEIQRRVGTAPAT